MVRSYQFLFILFLVAAPAVYGQGLEIGGSVVISGTNEALPGAIVRVKGTTHGAAADINGEFKLILPDMTQATLAVSYVGYKTVETEVSSSRSDLKVALEVDILKLSEVVATGFASSVKRQNLSHSVASVSGDELTPAPAQSIDQALAGKFAGINVSQNTGAPGGGISITLRGVSTIEGATQPLYVVDGVIVDNSATQSGIDLVTRASTAGSDRPQGQPVNRIADLNPNEIESIEVFKGASAAALYGSKATNGVVIITTKRGVAGETKVDFTQWFGMNTILNKLETRKFTATTALEQYGQTGLDLFNANGGRFLDYEDIVYGETGFINESNISISGGTARTQFFVSSLLRSEDGIVKNTGYDRFSGRVNVNHNISEKLNVDVFANFLRTESDRAITGNDNTNTTLGFSLGFTPSFIDIRPVNGVYPDHPLNPSNPLHTRDALINNELVYRTIGSAKLTWNLLDDGANQLDFIGIGGVDFYSQENRVLSPPELQFERNSSEPGASVAGATESVNSNLYLNLVHSLFSGGNQFKTSGGVQFENQDIDNILTEARGITPTQSNIDQGSSINAFQEIAKQRELGFYLQEEVNLSDKIFLTAGLRADASSANGDPDKFYFFPKASASIRLSEYGLWSGLKSAISEFKLRAAYGQTGNLAPPNAKYESMVPANIGGQAGVLLATRKGDPGIEPERAAEIEAGLDATFLNENATLEFSYFRKNISDLLLIPSLAPSTGQQDQYINGGKMKTDGIEVALGVTPLRSESFTWWSNINFFTTTSTITQLDVDPFNLGGFATFLGTYRIEEGLAPTTIIGAEVDAAGKSIPLGDENPDFQIGWNNRFTLGNLEIGFLLDWKQGGDVINLGKLITDLGGTTADYDELGVFNVGGKDTTMKNGIGRLTVLGAQTAPYIEDGTYLKLREASITYTFGREAVQGLFGGLFRYLRIGLTGRNLLVFTGYDGYDPEVSQFGNVAIGRSVDTIPFPSSRSFYFHIGFGL